MSKVYIIIVNFNNYVDTIECLESVLKSGYTNFQIFVVDNSADDTSINQLAGWAAGNNYQGVETNFKQLVYPPESKPLNYAITTCHEFNAGNLLQAKVTFIKAPNNGFAAANNVVLTYLLKHAEPSSFIWLLNNDTVIEKDALTNLVAFYNHRPNKKYIIGARLRNYHQPDTIQAIAGNYNVILGKHQHIGGGQQDTGQYNNYQPQKNDYIVGASMFLPQLFLQQVGLMCEDYFLYFEELDWINAGYKKGFAVAAVVNAIIYHKEGASITAHNGAKRDTAMAEYYSITNRVRFIKKWHPLALLTVMPGVIFALLKRLLQGRFKLAAKASSAVFKILFTGKPGIVRYDQ